MALRYKTLGILTAVVVLLGGCGGGDNDDDTAHDKETEATATPSRTVDVEMRDIAYAPDSVEVKAGETVRFVFRNVGQIRHDAFIGDEDAQSEHEKEMRSGMMDDHAGGALKIDPGKTGELVHTFKSGQTVLIGCHEEGHYVAGMKITLTVT